MIFVFCGTCSLGVRVMGDAQELEHLVGPSSEFWPDKFPCIQCGGTAVGTTEIGLEIPAKLRIQDLTPTEAFAAFNGLGIPSEHRCTFAEVTRLLKEGPIRQIRGADVQGTQRCIIESLELWDGTKIHLGASPSGAVVFRISRPHSYADGESDG